MRIIIVTDSLGMPRKNVPVECTWVSLFIQKYSAQHEIFTFLARGATTDSVLTMNNDLFYLYRPDLIIVQVGIVDCVRRALPLWFLRIISRIPLFSTLANKIARKFHYELTKIHQSSYVNLIKFKANMIQMVKECGERSIHFVLIRIADPGEFLEQKIFDVQKDIRQYNEVLQFVVNQFGGCYIDPYYNHFASDYILPEDGHHLNILGQKLVFESVSQIIESKITSNV